MRKRPALLLVALLALAVAAGVAYAETSNRTVPTGRVTQSYGEPYGVTLAPPSHSLITYGDTVRFTGVVSPPNNSGVPVWLYMKPTPNSTSHQVGSTVYSDANGRFSFTIRPPVNGRYQAFGRRDEVTLHSQIVSQRVRFRVSTHVGDTTPRIGQKVRFSGSVRPFRADTRVRVQRRTRRGSYTTIATTRTKPATATSASYSVRVRIRKTAYYRIRITGDIEHASGFGTRRRLRVH